jgi:hypothetical protein
MHLRLWRRSFQGGVTRQRLMAGALALALVVGVLTTSTLFSRHAAAAPGQRQVALTTPPPNGTPRLEVLTASAGGVYHQWSDDNGITWSGWFSTSRVKQLPGGGTGTLTVADTPSATSDGQADLMVVAQDATTRDLYYTFVNGPLSGSVWAPFQGEVGVGAVLIGTASYQIVSAPTVTSRGPWSYDLFVEGYTSANGGATVLLHLPLDGSGAGWESVGSPLTFRSNPVAVSWGLGRLDVFAQGPTHELEHLWFDQNTGGWHDWENKGMPSPTVTMSDGTAPAVTSSGVGLLNVLVRGSDGAFWHLGFYSTSWGGWSHIDCCVAASGGNPLGVAFLAPVHILDVFVIFPDHTLYHRVYSFTTNSWGPWQLLSQTFSFSTMTAVTWMPPTPPPPTATTTTPPAPPPPPTATPVWDPPTPTFSPNCGHAGQPPCTLPK